MEYSFKKANSQKGILIIRIEESLYFANIGFAFFNEISPKFPQE
jgi:hypothetical protein